LLIGQHVEPRLNEKEKSRDTQKRGGKLWIGKKKKGVKGERGGRRPYATSLDNGEKIREKKDTS